MSVSEKVYERLCKALNDYDKGDKEAEKLYKVLCLIFQEWEYIQRKL